MWRYCQPRSNSLLMTVRLSACLPATLVACYVFSKQDETRFYSSAAFYLFIVLCSTTQAACGVPFCSAPSHTNGIATVTYSNSRPAQQNWDIFASVRGICQLTAATCHLKGHDVFLSRFKVFHLFPHDPLATNCSMTENGHLSTRRSPQLPQSLPYLRYHHYWLVHGFAPLSLSWRWAKQRVPGWPEVQAGRSLSVATVKGGFFGGVYGGARFSDYLCMDHTFLWGEKEDDELPFVLLANTYIGEWSYTNSENVKNF